MSGEADGSAAVKAVKRPALGRGLGALLGETRREEAVSRISVSAPGEQVVSGLASLSVASI
jgi:ParB family chromosome partitioning protein